MPKIKLPEKVPDQSKLSLTLADKAAIQEIGKAIGKEITHELKKTKKVSKKPTTQPVNKKTDDDDKSFKVNLNNNDATNIMLSVLTGGFINPVISKALRLPPRASKAINFTKNFLLSNKSNAKKENPDVKTIKEKNLKNNSSDKTSSINDKKNKFLNTMNSIKEFFKKKLKQTSNKKENTEEKTKKSSKLWSYLLPALGGILLAIARPIVEGGINRMLQSIGVPPETAGFIGRTISKILPGALLGSKFGWKGAVLGAGLWLGLDSILEMSSAIRGIFTGEGEKLRNETILSGAISGALIGARFGKNGMGILVGGILGAGITSLTALAADFSARANAAKEGKYTPPQTIDGVPLAIFSGMLNGALAGLPLAAATNGASILVGALLGLAGGTIWHIFTNSKLKKEAGLVDLSQNNEEVAVDVDYLHTQSQTFKDRTNLAKEHLNSLPNDEKAAIATLIYSTNKNIEEYDDKLKELGGFKHAISEWDLDKNGILDQAEKNELEKDLPGTSISGLWNKHRGFAKDIVAIPGNTNINEYMASYYNKEYKPLFNQQQKLISDNIDALDAMLLKANINTGTQTVNTINNLGNEIKNPNQTPIINNYNITAPMNETAYGTGNFANMTM